MYREGGRDMRVRRRRDVLGRPRLWQARLRGGQGRSERRDAWTVVGALVSALLLGLLLTSGGAGAQPAGKTAAGPGQPNSVPQHVCGPPRAGFARCHAIVWLSAKPTKRSSTTSTTAPTTTSSTTAPTTTTSTSTTTSTTTSSTTTTSTTTSSTTTSSTTTSTSPTTTSTTVPSTTTTVP